MTFGDLDLFVLGVAGDPDDLHAVHERLGHPQGVGGGHEHDIRKVVVHLKIVIVEAAVLFGVQDLQKR